ncbi:MAG: hypothetical protein U0586_07410 [Candidatus Brocadiaceae bacterium]
MKNSGVKKASCRRTLPPPKSGIILKSKYFEQRTLKADTGLLEFELVVRLLLCIIFIIHKEFAVGLLNRADLRHVCHRMK